MLLLAQLGEGVSAIDHAAQQGVVWFLCAAVVAMATAMVWKAKVDQRRNDHVSARLDTVQDQHTKYCQENTALLIEALNKNSSAMLEFSHSLSSIHRLLEGRSHAIPNLP